MPKVLLVDDEQSITKVMHRVLRDILPISWAVEIESSAITGLSRAVLDPAVRICVIDLVMPEMDGQELIQKTIALRPELKIIVSSGYPIDGSEWDEIFGKIGCHRLDKPVRFDDAKRLLWQLISEIEEQARISNIPPTSKS